MALTPLSPPAAMDTFPPSPPTSPSSSLYDAPLRGQDADSPSLTEAVMLAVTPTSPRKKMKAPVPQQVKGFYFFDSCKWTGQSYDL